jgi:hypothetical protein
VDFYVKMGWHMVPLGFKNKRPAAGSRWADRGLTRHEALKHVLEERGNLGIMGGDKIIFLDYDSKDAPLEVLGPRTMKMSTPNGYIIATKPPFKPTLFDRLKAAYARFDVPRTDIMYVAVPISETCRGEKKNVHACAEGAHDWRVREWIDPNDGELWSFRKYAEEVLKVR